MTVHHKYAWGMREREFYAKVLCLIYHTTQTILLFQIHYMFCICQTKVMQFYTQTRTLLIVRQNSTQNSETHKCTKRNSRRFGQFNPVGRRLQGRRTDSAYIYSPFYGCVEFARRTRIRFPPHMWCASGASQSVRPRIDATQYNISFGWRTCGGRRTSTNASIVGSGFVEEETAMPTDDYRRTKRIYERKYNENIRLCCCAAWSATSLIRVEWSSKRPMMGRRN